MRISRGKNYRATFRRTLDWVRSNRLRALLVTVLFGVIVMPTAFFVARPFVVKALACPCNIFSSTPSPSDTLDAGGIEVGMKFKSDSNGTVTGIRFYKTAAMTGAHTGNLWDANGNNLASVVFGGGTATGWQEATFSTAVPITANTIYTISVFHANGVYAFTSNYFTSEVANAPLRAPADGLASDGLGNVGQGVFNSANTSSYPSASFNKTNYWVDVQFFDTSAPTVTTVDPANSATNIGHGKTISSTFDQGMDATSFTTSTFVVKDGANAIVPGTVSYNTTTKTASFIATDGFNSSQTYTATLKGGGGISVKNMAGVALAADYTWSFTVAATNSCPCSFKDKANPAGSTTFDDVNGNEVGMKIRPSTNGYITAIRFYKPIISSETTHTGRIWSSTGTSLATVSFTNETDYGWQEARLSSPLRVNENQTYIVSYGTTTAVYQATTGGLNSTLTNGYLNAYADNAAENAATGSGNRNGVFSSTAGSYPNQGSTNGSYFWIDTVFSVSPVVNDPLEVTVTQPTANSYGVPHNKPIKATFDYTLNASTVTNSSVRLFDSSNNQVSGTASYDASSASAVFTPSGNLAYGQRYTMKLSASIADSSGNALGSEYSWSFTVGSALSTDPNQGPGGPVLVITSTTNKYSPYYAEILRTEGLNYFDVKDISTVSGGILANYDAVVLAEMSLTQPQADMLNAWVTTGGNLVAMRPDKKLAGLLGLSDLNSTRTNQYVTVHTGSGPGAGIVGESMQFKGAADNYSLNGASTVATLYSDASTATSSPAVTYRAVGSQGGMAMAFTYDLAKSVIAQHQGNQAWAGQDRDGLPPTRSNDLFFGARIGDVQPDWVDLTKIHIPQADEQQRLLGNLLTEATKDRRPLPKFWYLPKDYKAAMIMAGDDHALNNIVGTERTLSNWLNESTTYCSVTDWQCVRGTNYTYETSALTQARALQYFNFDFGVGAHVSNNALCNNYTSYAQLSGIFTSELATWRAKYTGMPNQTTHRYHCYVWSDWDSMSRVDVDNGMRYDLNYVAYPSTWVNNRAPILTGSGMNMRLTDADGDMLDVHQGVTNLDDTSASSTAINALLDNALGSSGYYGIFGTHFGMTDTYHTTLFNAAKARGIPMISAEQALTWLEGRNSSTFSNFSGSNGNFTFTIAAGVGAQYLKAMMPINDNAGTLTTLKLASTDVSYQTQTIKGVQYAVFNAAPGDYTVTYSDYVAPSIPDDNTPAPSGGQSTASSLSGSQAKAKSTGDSVNEPTTVLGDETPAQQNQTTSSLQETPKVPEQPKASGEGLNTSNIAWWVWFIGFVGVLFLAILFWLFWKRRRRQ